MATAMMYFCTCDGIGENYTDFNDIIIMLASIPRSTGQVEFCYKHSPSFEGGPPPASDFL